VRMCARKHVVDIVAKRFVGEIGANVDQLHWIYDHRGERGIMPRVHLRCFSAGNIHTPLTARA
jgi:hypothetical protein